MKTISIFVWIVLIGSSSLTVASSEIAPLDQFLFTASLSHGSNHICTGIILNKLWILTSALCMSNDNSIELKVIYGSHNRTHMQRTENTIAKIVSHPEFNATTLHNNLALIKVKRSITFIPTVVQAVFLSIKEPKVNDVVVAIGWERITEETVCSLLFSHSRLQFR